ncbi:hypothetical protein EXN22_16325 [Pseudomonas tructae]|uniref:Uncharacterized protein n=1 Tax=Pseudomonas tructae TaxID=2518644 RepID=A0A411MK67_9PSED|nr:hypothetical protein [Pseudomonas tructae]QBF27181.1 hypothetical protein EXN22_16325 [Pseudomonas tructae]
MIGKLKKPVYWVTILVIAGLASAIGKEIGAQLGKPSNDELLRSATAQAIKQINDQTPKKVDELTTMLRAELGGSHEMTTFFELANYDSWGASADLTAGKSAVVKSLCENPRTVKTMRMGAKFGYVYLKEDGTEVYRFRVSKDDCP